MDGKKIIICLLIVIILILVAGIYFIKTNHAKIESEIIVTSNSTLNSGDTFSIKLTDSNNTPLKQQKVNITIIDNNGTETTKIITTTDSGKGNFELSKFEVGNYTIKVKYSGNENYSECNITEEIEIIEEIVESEPTETTSDTNEEYDDGYWETSPDADFEYHTEYYSDGEFRQFDHDGNLVGSSYDEDQAELQEKFPRR